MTYRNTLTAFAAFAIAASLSGGAFAQATGAMASDKMSTGAMASDHMKSGAMASDHMKADAMKSDGAMKADAMKKPMKKEAKTAAMASDKGAMTHGAMATDAMAAKK